MKSWLSKKLIMTIVGLILVPLLQAWGVPQDTIEWLIGLIGVYVGGQAAVDAARNWGVTTPHPSENPE